MAFGRLLVLPSLLILILYIRNLVAVENKQGNVVKDIDSDPFQFDTLSAALSGDKSGLNVISNFASAIPINFDPLNLDFIEQPIGMPNIQEVIVSNPTHSLTLQLISISGNQPDFHSSFFISKVLRPGESTSFEIVFLPRHLGFVEDTLTIHSSFGAYEYKVMGTGISNPFRLRPLKGARIPINATYSPSISMYNPYNTTLQILEVYSSGGYLHLELPNGLPEGNETIWEIRPFETKQIAKAIFSGQHISNHTAFVRIKTNHSTNPSIVLPVEVEVSDASGLFLSRELLDFGMIKSGGSARLPLYVLNAGPYQVEVKSITPVPDNPAIKVEYANLTLKPSTKYTKIGFLVFSVGAFIGEEQESGIVKIWAEDKASFHQLTVPYEAQIQTGSLEFEQTDTLFRVHDPPFHPVLRNITLLNRFEFPVVIYSAKLSLKAQEMFSIHSFNSPYILQPDNQWHKPIMLKFQAQSSDCLFNTTLRLATNASFFNIPLQCYDGSLDYDFGGSDVDAIEFGLLSDHDTAFKMFTISNPNPVRVSLTSIQVHEKSNIPYTSVHLVSIPPQIPINKKDMIGSDGLKKGRRPPYFLDPGQEILFRINVTRPKRPGKFSGEILIYSSLGKVVPVPVNYQSVLGGVQVIPDRIIFEPAFPYSTSTVRLHIKSTYTKPVKLVSLTLNTTNSSIYDQSNNDRMQPLIPIKLPSELPIINPSTTTVIGELVLDPLLFETEFIFTQISLNDTVDFTQGILLDKDVEQFELLWKAWQFLLEKGLNWFNFSVVIETEIDKEILVSGSGSLEWPRIVYPSILEFPLTLIGNTSELSIRLYNPSTYPLQIRPIFLQETLDSDHILQTLSDKFNIDTILYNNSVEQSYSLSLSSNNTLGFDKSTPHILPPHGNWTLGVGFSPSTDQLTNGLLLLHNNLTMFDFVEFKGLGSKGFITVGGVHPGGPNSLLFEFTPAMLEGCLAGLEYECGISTHDPSYTKTFLIRNSGTTPLMVTSSLSDNSCQENGFHVTNCGKPFAVYPNRTRKVEITCTPDYTLSRITNILRLHTTTGAPMDFPLLATLPHHMLVTCYEATPTSELESLASYLSVPLWLLALLVMIIATVLQVNWHTRRLHQTMSKISIPTSGTSYSNVTSKVVSKEVPIQATGGPIFNLSGIARRVPSNITDRFVELGRSVLNNSTEKTNRSSSSIPTNSSSSLEQSTDMDKISCEQKSDTFSRHTPILSEMGMSPVEHDSVSVTDHQTGIRLESNYPQSYTNDSKTTTKTINEELLESETTPSQPFSTPTKKSKSKRIVMKVEKSPNKSVTPPDTSSSHTHPISLASSAVTVVKLEQFKRKESDESIPSSESDLGSTDQSSLTPDLEESTPPNDLILNNNATNLKTSYTKEPGTGQTVPVKDREENGTDEVSPVSVDKSPHPSSSSSSTSSFSSFSSAVVSVSVSVKPRSKKKQKAQQKREDKLRRRRRERERDEQANSKCLHDSQESIDKESITSSTNSTDNLDEYGTEQPTPDEEGKKNIQEEDRVSNGDNLAEEGVVGSDIWDDEGEKMNDSKGDKMSIGQVQEDQCSDVSSVMKEHVLENENVEDLVSESDSTQQENLSVNRVKPVEQDEITTKPVQPVKGKNVDDSVENEFEELVNNSITKTVKLDEPVMEQELETITSSMEFQTSSPSPENMITEPPKVLKSTPKKLLEILADPFSQSPDRSTYMSRHNNGRLKLHTQPHTPSPDKSEESNSVPVSPNKTEKTEENTRPMELNLDESNEEGQDPCQKVLSSETNTVENSTKALPVHLGISSPHELATSLLQSGDIIARPKHKIEKEKLRVDEQDEVEKRRRRISAETQYNEQMRDKRSRQLSHDAQPFYPHYQFLPPPPPPPPPPSLPPPPPPHPNRAPLLPSHHRMPSPPYEFPPMRPTSIYIPEESGSERMYERKQRKRSETQKFSKSYTPSPSYPDRGRYERQPYPSQMYESEWVGPHRSHMSPGYLEDDNFPLYTSQYPHEPRRGAYPRNRLPPARSPYHVSSNFDSTRGGSRQIARCTTITSDGTDSLWELPTSHHVQSSRVTNDNAFYMEQLRKRQQLQKLQQHQLASGFDVTDPIQRHPNESEHSRNIYSVSQLRDRHLDSTYGNRGNHYSPYPQFDVDDNSLLSEMAHLHQLRCQDKLHSRSNESSHDDLSRLLNTPSSSLNRAPGTLPESLGQNTGASRLSSLFGDGNDITTPSQSLFGDSELPSARTTRSRTTTPPDSSSTAWQSLWLMDSPLLSALEEQRQQAAANTSTRKSSTTEKPTSTNPNNVFTENTYDLFERRGRSIWSLTDNDPSNIFPWVPKPNSKNNSD